MNILRNLLFITAFSVTLTAYSQGYKTAINDEFTTYVTHLVNLEFEESMEYLPESLFDIIPKDQMLMVIKQAFNNPDIEIKLLDPKILKINDAEKIEDKFYALLTYSNIMKMRYISEEDETEDEAQMRTDITKLSLEKMFGKKNVSFDEETSFFEIYVKKDVYAISTNGQNQWKFLAIEENQKQLLEKLLPKQLTKKL
jgi:hypothetical protein